MSTPAQLAYQLERWEIASFSTILLIQFPFHQHPFDTVAICQTRSSIYKLQLSSSLLASCLIFCQVREKEMEWLPCWWYKLSLFDKYWEWRRWWDEKESFNLNPMKWKQICYNVAGCLWQFDLLKWLFRMWILISMFLEEICIWKLLVK